MRADLQDVWQSISIPSLRDSAKQNRGKPPYKKIVDLQGGLPRSLVLARNDASFLDSAIRRI